MAKTKKAGGACNEEEGICRRKYGNRTCKNASADNELHYCEKHYKTWEMEKKKLPPVEKRCSHTNGSTRRCKQFRMGHGEDKNRVLKSNYCEKHYEEQKKLPPDEHRCSQTGGNGIYRYRCKKFSCGKHRNLNAKYYKNLMEKKISGDCEDEGSGPIEEETRSCDDISLDDTSDLEGGSGNIRRKNKSVKTLYRLLDYSLGESEDSDRYVDSENYSCNAKYNQNHLKKRSGDGEYAGCGAAGPIECGGLRRRRKEVTDEDNHFLDVTGSMQPATSDDTCGESAKIGTKTKKIETTSKELKTSKAICEPVLELENLDSYKTECFQVSVELELAKKELELAKKKLELAKKTGARDEHATEYWRNKCSDLETLVLSLEIEDITMRYEETRGSRRRRQKKVTDEEDDLSLDDTCDTADIQGCFADAGTKRMKNKEMENKKLPPDEQRCSRTGFRGWRCKNFRMGHGGGPAAVPKTRYCEKHHKLRKYKKKTSGDHGEGTADDGTENQKLEKKKEEETENNKLPPDEQRCGRTGFRGWRCKNFRMGHGDADAVPKTRYCEKHYKLRSMKYKKKTSGGHGEGTAEEIRDSKRRVKKVAEEDDRTENQKHKKKEEQMEKKKLLPPDEHRCSQTGGGGWRCKNFRMGLGDDDNVPKSRHCEKHYYYYANQNQIWKKRNKDGEGAGSGPIKQETRRKKDTIDDTSVVIAEGGSGNIRRKRKNIKRTKDDGFVYDTLGEFEGYIDSEDYFGTSDVNLYKKVRGEDDTHGESEDCDSYVDSQNFVGDLVDMLGMENLNWNNDEMRWNSESDMLSSFQEDPVLLYL